MSTIRPPGATRYDGGRSWYTGGGHTNESFAEPNFRQHLLGGIKWAAKLVDGECGGTVWSSFERVTLAKTAAETGEPIGLAVLPDRGVLHTSRDGTIRYTNAAGDTKIAANLPVYSHDEDGLQAITIDPGFATNNWVYVYYSPPLSTPGGDAPTTGTPAQFAPFNGKNHLSRFKWDPQARADRPGLRADAARGRPEPRHLLPQRRRLRVGRRRQPVPLDRRRHQPVRVRRLLADRRAREPEPGVRRPAQLGQHERPARQGAADQARPGDGDLHDSGRQPVRPRPERHAARDLRDGLPQPVPDLRRQGDRLRLRRPTTGPTAALPSATRGPGGQVEFSVLRAPGNYGWPYCTGDNDAFIDYNFATAQSGAAFNCASPVNTSPNNTGVQALPAAVLPDIWYGNGGPWEAEMQPGGSESPMAGPVYHYDASNPSETKFPAYYDDHWFPYEWGRDWIKETALDSTGGPLEVSAFLDDPAFEWENPMDMEFGPDGSLYVLDYGGGFFGGDASSALYRVDYVQGGRRPIAVATADKTSTSATTLTVQFSSAGSRDPDGGGITYLWDFGDGSPTSTDPNPTHTYAAVGSYRATLTVTDETDKTGTADVTIVVGNAAPVIAVNSPAEGGFFDFGDQIPYDVTVTDAEDGTVSGTSPDCSRVEIDYLLGHDSARPPAERRDRLPGRHPDRRRGRPRRPTRTSSASSPRPTRTRAARPAPARCGPSTEIVLWPKLLQAEHYTEMRGIQVVAQANAGGGERVGYTDNAGGTEAVNYIAWDPVNLLNISSLTVTASSGGSGGPIQVRLDDPATGPLLGTVNVPNTGAWETQQDFQLPITAPTGRHKLFLAFPNGGLDVDQIRFNGRGISQNAQPTASAAATPTEGAAPLAVQFTGTATDPEGGALTYEWDFGDGTADATTKDARTPTRSPAPTRRPSRSRTSGA